MDLKKQIHKTIPIIIEKLGYLFNPLILKFKNEKNKLLIFYFHGLYESTTQKDLNHGDPQNNLTVSQFEKFIKYFLQKKYHFIKPEDLLEDLPANQPYAMITFDDGYFNNSLALDVLNKYNVPATFFLTTNNIIENKSFWWDVVYRNRMKQGVSLKKISEEQQSLKNFKYPEIDNYIENKFGSNSYKPWSDIDRPFTRSEIRSIAQNPLVSIGNHTHNHAILSNYMQEEMINEFRLSNQILFELTGKTPIAVAFPNGNYNESILNVAKKMGFRFAFTTQNHINHLPFIDNEMICLNRFMAKTEDIKTYGSFIRMGYNPHLLYNNLKKIFFFRKLSPNKP